MLRIYFFNFLRDHLGKININTNYIFLSEKGLFSQRAVFFERNREQLEREKKTHTKCSIIWKPREGWKGWEFAATGPGWLWPHHKYLGPPLQPASHPPSSFNNCHTPPPSHTPKLQAHRRPVASSIRQASSPVISSSPLPSPKPLHSRSLHALAPTPAFGRSSGQI